MAQTCLKAHLQLHWADTGHMSKPNRVLGLHPQNFAPSQNFTCNLVALALVDFPLHVNREGGSMHRSLHTLEFILYIKAN